MFVDGDSKLWCFCARLHTSLGRRFFMEDPSVVKAIEKNQPEVFANAMNSLIQKAMGIISKKDTYIGKHLRLPKMQSLIRDYGRLVAHIISESEQLLLGKKKLEDHHRILIIIQLTIWSCFSKMCSSKVAYLLHYFMMAKIDFGIDETWSWLFCLTTCVYPIQA